MDKYEELKKMLCKELEEFEKKGKLSAGDLETVDKLTHAIKSLVTIMAMEESKASGDGYSGYGRSGARGRDSMGRFTSGRRGRYSREEARSYMADQLSEMMADASGEERDILAHARSRLENMM